MHAKDLMTAPVVTLRSDTHLKDVAAIFVRRGINAAPVVEDGHLVGIVSEADLIPLEAGSDRRFATLASERGPLPRTVREVMTRSVFTVSRDTDASQAARLMLRHNLKSVPVVVGDRVVGMMSRRDLLRVIARSDQVIQAELARRVEEEADVLRRTGVDVRDGVVTFTGGPGEPARAFLEALARTIPGVADVAWAAPGGIT
jgi:CBS domain-containing protein